MSAPAWWLRPGSVSETHTFSRSIGSLLQFAWHHLNRRVLTVSHRRRVEFGRNGKRLDWSERLWAQTCISLCAITIIMVSVLVFGFAHVCGQCYMYLCWTKTVFISNSPVSGLRKMVVATFDMAMVCMCSMCQTEDTPWLLSCTCNAFWNGAVCIV